ncbi:MAG: YciI family protein [Planctomycetota bacterium]
MKFMLMMNCPRNVEATLASWKPEEFQAHVQFMLRLNDELRQRGELVLAEGLDMPTAARIVRGQTDGPPLVTDGPFAEAKEFLAGFWIVDCVSRERAVEIAGQASLAPGPGGKPMGIPIELRQVMQAPECDA